MYVYATMSYDDLAHRLATDDRTRRITAFPDGSVDVYYTAFDGTGDRIEEREALGERIATAEHASFPVERESREPGGQAVNMARQVHALGDETTLYGHLDDPVFADLPFETVSMGDPSRISVFPFADDDLLLAQRSPDVEDWSLADLETAVSDGDAREALTADAICCGNWASAGRLTDALATLADGSLEAEVFVLDPGAVSTRSREALTALLETLDELDETVDVICSVNRTELEYAADAVGADSDATGVDGDRERLATVRETAGITAAVLHETEIAAAATRDGEAVVENLSVDDPVRRTGAGDRFSAGLAVARAREWEWETALALGNCSASYYVETGETGTRDEFRSFLSARLDR